LRILIFSKTRNNTTETKIVDSQLVLNDAVNEQVPVKTAMPLEVNDQSYNVTKWVSFAGNCNS
jgi:Na+-transporting NADH:ubiquinone oxidoreductase subunit NqrF